MTEVALGVHTENPNGAYDLYAGLGYEVSSDVDDLPQAALNPSGACAAPHFAACVTHTCITQ